MVREKQTRSRRPNKAMRHVRTVTGLSMREFAGKVRTSAARIQKIEDGTLKMPDELAVAVMALTGASPESLVEGSEAKTIAGRPFTARTYTSWRTLRPRREVVEAAADRIADLARALVLASYGQTDEIVYLSRPERFREVLVLLSETLADLGARFNLVGEANLVLADRAVAGDEREVSFAELKRLLEIEPDQDEVPARWDKERATKVSDHCLVKITEKQHPLWHRLAGAVSLGNASAGLACPVFLDRLRIEARLPWRPREKTALVVDKFKGSFIGQVGQTEPVHEEKPEGKRDVRRQARRSTTKKRAGK